MMNVVVCCSYFRESLVELLVRDLGSGETSVHFHLWALEATLPGVAEHTRGVGRIGKFQALNRLLPYVTDADIVLFADDDIRVCGGFLERYLSIIDEVGASVAQPALSAGSHHSHDITLQQDACLARLTNFVETGPLFSMSRDFLDEVAPFSESNPMGWGNDVHWSAVAEARGQKMAIVDACPIEHTFRGLWSRYSAHRAWWNMKKFLAEHGMEMPEHKVLRRYSTLTNSNESPAG